MFVFTPSLWTVWANFPPASAKGSSNELKTHRKHGGDAWLLPKERCCPQPRRRRQSGYSLSLHPPQMPAGLFQMLAKMVTGQTLGERALRSAAAVSALAAVTSGHRAGTWGTLRKGASLCVRQITRGQENSEFLFLNACSGISHKPLGLGTMSIPGSAASLTGTCQSEQPEGAKRSLSTNVRSPRLRKY